MTQWEYYKYGSPEAEREIFRKLARDIMRVQSRVKKKEVATNIDRAFHAKQLLGVMDAKFTFVSKAKFPKEFRTGFAKPGAEYIATVRISNASSTHRPDVERVLRGIALRIAVTDSQSHDLLMTNYPVSHARDAKQFVAFAVAFAGNRAVGVVKLIYRIGPFEAVRMLISLFQATRRQVTSLADESFWSRGAMLWGEAGPVRYFLRPIHRPADADKKKVEAQYVDLRKNMAELLKTGEVTYEFCVQKYVHWSSTPIEDAAKEWPEQVAPAIVLAHLVIRQQIRPDSESDAIARRVNQLNFNPWYTTPGFRPLGNINRARKAAYEASSAHRAGFRHDKEVPFRNWLINRVSLRLFTPINHLIPWYGWCITAFQLFNLSILRHQLREENLIDTDPPQAPPNAIPVPDPIPEDVRLKRTFTGQYNDLSQPKMGAVGARFGRNMEPEHRSDSDNDYPNPITIADTLLKRDRFIPATTLNVLAAAWIQFQVHDWVQHSKHDPGENDIVIELPPGSEPWKNAPSSSPEREMRIAGNIESTISSSFDAANAPEFENKVTHWWDGSAVYGSCKTSANILREDCGDGQLKGARLRLKDNHLPTDVNGQEVTGFNESWWLGLSAMHTLFAREHNSVCDALKTAYGDWTEERVYQTARLVVSALIAKIHTIEWTPAILGTEALDIGMNSNWSGPKKAFTKIGLWLADKHALQGIPQTFPYHDDVPYSLTEEFVSVYRMHPLIPDEYRMYNHSDGTLISPYTFKDIQGQQTDDVMSSLGLQNVLYSLGIAHPGAITLHNYPHSLMQFEDTSNDTILNLAVVDIVRDRTRGVPRYNEFRKGLHKLPLSQFEHLSNNPETVKLLKKVYKNNIDGVDTMVGLLAETPPPGFGFSDTAFRIFILMASRRLQSDRFLTVDFRPEVYSKVGFEWVHNNTMTSILLRHHPELRPVLPRNQTPFAPWRALPASV